MENKKRTLQKMPPLKIGNVEMPNPLVLAPMAGVTDLPFRVLCKEQGAGLICMEMVSAKAILYKNKNTEDLMTIHPGEHPVSLQLFGSDPEILAQIADKNGGPTKILAQALLDEYEKLGVPIRQIVFREGSHGDYYYTNRAAAALNIPALTSEFCFIDNEEDQKFIDSEEDWQKQARAQCNAILYYFTQVQY